MKNLWHTLTIEKTFEKVDSSATGLTPNQILERQNKYGKNKLIEKKKRKPIILFLPVKGLTGW